MDMTPFTAAPCSTRHDGWSPALKGRFLDHLASCGNVAAACAAVRMSREAAYRLRRRDPLFARGWAAALLLAREAGADALADMALGGIEEEIWYRGELKGTRRRFDARLILAHLARLDRLAEAQHDTAGADADRFDEIVALIAGAQVPGDLELDDGALPLPREAAVEEAELAARDAVIAAWEDKELTEQAYPAYLQELEGEGTRARAEAGARWDAWQESACAVVDALRDEREGHAAPGTPSGLSTSAAPVVHPPALS